jgi:hypothetical protein
MRSNALIGKVGKRDQVSTNSKSSEIPFGTTLGIYTLIVMFRK